MSISNPEIKKLYGLSAGRCNICKIDVFENDVHIGEMAHIIAKKLKGPRGNEDFSNNINSYENLILLCANHHSEVDQNTQLYTTKKLKNLKKEHEESIASIFNTPKERVDDAAFIKAFMRYVPFTRLLYFIENLPKSVKLDLCLVGDIFEALCKDNPHLYPLNDQNLQHYFSEFTGNYYKLWELISGFTDINGREQANFSQADDNFYIHMERKYLTYETVSLLNKSIDNSKNSFITSYMQLIDFLRNNYKEIDLNSYSSM